MSPIYDIEYDLMKWCLNEVGSWWANHFFYNKEVRMLYSRLRSLSIDVVLDIINTKKI